MRRRKHARKKHRRRSVMKVRGLRRPARRRLKRLLKGMSARYLRKRRRNPLSAKETREVRAWAYRLLRYRRLRSPEVRKLDYGRASMLMDVIAKYGRGRSRRGAHARGTRLLTRALYGGGPRR